MLSGMKAMLQKLNGSQHHSSQLPSSVPSLAVGHHESVHTPPHSAHTGSSSAADFRQDPQGTLQQPQGHSHVLEGAAQQRLTHDEAATEVAEPSGQQEDEWDVLLRCVTALFNYFLVHDLAAHADMQLCASFMLSTTFYMLMNTYIYMHMYKFAF